MTRPLVIARREFAAGFPVKLSGRTIGEIFLNANDEWTAYINMQEGIGGKFAAECGAQTFTSRAAAAKFVRQSFRIHFLHGEKK